MKRDGLALLIALCTAALLIAAGAAWLVLSLKG